MPSSIEDSVRSTLEGENAQPERIGPYRFRNLLGIGGMGAVYRAWDERLDRWVAVKRIRPTVLADETTRARFRHEALAVAQLSHPSIVPIFDLLQTEDGDWIVMECVEGTNLSQLIHERLLTLDQTLLLVRDIAEGLSEAHSKGIIHCDLKTENVLVTPAGRARILDFGLARQLSRNELPSKEGVLIGTARAMSPEQVRLQEIDHRSDIFSLGTLFYEALTGKNPFAGRTPVETLMHIVHDRPLPVHELCPEVPEAISLLIERMQAKESDQRPQSAGEVVAALDAITGLVVREVPAPAMSSPDDARTIVATLLASELVMADGELDPVSARRYDQVVRDLLARHEGRRLERPGGMLLLFERPTNALRFALDYHRGLARLSADAGVKVAARVGIQLSELHLDQEQAETPLTRPHAAPTRSRIGAVSSAGSAGLARKLTERVMSLAAGGQTLLTGPVFDLARQGLVTGSSEQTTLSWLSHGSYLLDGIEEPIEVFECGVEGEAPLKTPEDTGMARRVIRQMTVPGWRPACGLRIPLRPNWSLERKLAEGGIGEVWLARHAKTGDDRVFKFCFEAGRLSSLKREITLFRLLKEELGARDDITRILDWNFDQAPYFIEAEYTQGGSMIDWAKEQGGIAQVPLVTRLELVAQVAEALAAAHSVGVLHKDVKPGNILITRDEHGNPKAQLTDFGIGRVTDRERLARAGITMAGLSDMATERQSTSMSGTRLYMAPELLEGRPATLQADIYALGVVLYQVLIGDFSRALASGWERDIEDEVLRETISMAVDGSPRRRLGSALDLSSQLRALEQRQQEREMQRRERQEAERAKADVVRLRRRWQQAFAAVALLVLVAAVVTVLQRRTAVVAARASRAAVVSDQVSRFMAEAFKQLNPYRTDTRTTADLLALSKAQVERKFKGEPEIQARLQNILGDVYLALGRYEDAELLLEDALALRRSVFGPEHSEVTDSLQSLALLRYYQGDYEAAEQLCRQVLEQRRKLFPGPSTKVADSLHALALVLHEKGDLAPAEELYQQALAIRRQVLGDDHPDVATSLNDLGTLREDQGDYALAEQLHREALAIRQRALDPQHPDVSTSLSNLAAVLHSEGKYSEAEPLYREAAERMGRLLGEGHPDTVNVRNNLATLLHQQGKVAEAEPIYRDVLERRRQLFGEAHPHVATSLSNLAALLRDIGQYDEAELRTREALNMRRQLLGPTHPKVATSLNSLAGLLLRKGDADGAETLLREALAIRRHTYGDGHSLVAATQVELARVQLTRGQPVAAEQLLQEALRHLRASLTAANPRVLEAEVVLADCMIRQGRYPEAERLLLAGYPQLRTQAGESSPQVREALEQLVRLYQQWNRPDQAAEYRARLDRAMG